MRTLCAATYRHLRARRHLLARVGMIMFRECCGLSLTLARMLRISVDGIAGREGGISGSESNYAAATVGQQ